ncbi:hypothetical protein FB451DRAFT_1208814 [Mycena latifolia]|nr:hypothetical protein FB451DRAFT_1208814 [Mycena latifolia]
MLAIGVLLNAYLIRPRAAACAVKTHAAIRGRGRDGGAAQRVKRELERDGSAREITSESASAAASMPALMPALMPAPSMGAVHGTSPAGCALASRCSTGGWRSMSCARMSPCARASVRGARRAQGGGHL